MPSSRDLLDDARRVIPEVTAAQVAKERAAGTLIDVRERSEFDEGHIPGATHLSKGYIEVQIEDRVPARDTPITLYCAGGTRSLLAARALHELGYSDVRSMSGGFNGWKQAGFDFDVPRVLSADQRRRYNRHLIIPEVGEDGQGKLLDAKVLLIGAGGLGSPVALYLAAAGVGTIGLVDFDIVDDIEIDETDGAHPRSCKVEGRRAAQPSGADQQHLGGEQLGLTLLPDLGDEQVPVVAALLVGGQRAGDIEGEARLLPAVETTAHGANVAVAELVQGTSGQQGPGPACAVQRDRGVLVGDSVLDLDLDEALAEMERSGDVALLELAALAHIDESSGASLLGDLLGGHLGDDAASVVEKIARAGHVRMVPNTRPFQSPFPSSPGAGLARAP